MIGLFNCLAFEYEGVDPVPIRPRQTNSFCFYAVYILINMNIQYKWQIQKKN